MSDRLAILKRTENGCRKCEDRMRTGALAELGAVRMSPSCGVHRVIGSVRPRLREGAGALVLRE